jgi:predicted permease
MQTLWQDLQYAVRMLRKTPGFTLVAVLTLAVAIGANAVVFGVMNALFLHSLNVPQSDSLYQLERASDKQGNESYLNYVDLRDRNRSFNGLAACNLDQAGLDTGQNAIRAWLCEASGNYFDSLGVQPYLGRFFHASDEQGPNSAPYIVLTYAYWHSHFQGDRGVIGRTVQLNKHPFSIIGVAPPGFQGTLLIFSPAFFVPLVNQEQIDGTNLLNKRAERWMDTVVGRLKPGVTPAQAIADLNSIGAYLTKSYPKDEDQMTFVLARPALGGDAIGPSLQAFVAGLMLLAGLILLAACANLGSLFGARAADRSKEVALRLALGAGRLRILQQLFTEALLISVIGGAVGLWCSVVLLRALSSWNPFPLYPVNLPMYADAKVYGVALLLALVSGFLFGAVPVRQVLRTDPYQIVKSGSVVAVGRRLTVRDALLAVQIAICAVLVTSSFVAVRGLLRSLYGNFGFEPRNTILIESDVTMAGYTGDRVATMQRRMIDAVQTIPGLDAVGLVAQYPPLQLGYNNSDVFVDQTSDFRPSKAAARPVAYSISPDYFQAAGTALLMGRAFTWRDDSNSPRVAVVNGVFANKMFGSTTNALGRYYKTSDGTRVQVVGIVEDGKYTTITEDPQPAIFLPILQSPWSETWLVVRSRHDPPQLAAAIRSALRELDSGLPVFVQTWSEEMNGALFASRMAAASLGVLGAMGGLLSVTGIFGMAAYSVSKRLKELGIRMALGAQRGEVLQAALGRALKLLAFGSAAGLLLGLLASRVLAVIVFQATPRDPVVLAGVVLAMSLLGLVATWIPARRALSIEPSVLLREE